MDLNKSKDPDTVKNRKKQYMVISCILGVVAIFVIIFGGKDNSSKYAYDEKIDTEALVKSILSGNQAENNFALKQESEIRENKKKLDELNDRIDNIIRENKKLKQQLKTNTQDANKVIDIQSKTILDLEKNQNTPPSFTTPPIKKPTSSNISSNNDELFTTTGISPQQNLSGSTKTSTQPQSSGGQINFTLERGKQGKKFSEYIPAGTYVKATIISGAAATVGIRGGADPKPILMRMKGSARTADTVGDGGKSTINLDGCLVTGQAKAELSSETVYIRTLTLTCSFATGTAVEYTINGYVAGTGKAGIRGIVISREGDLIEKSFVAGLVSGLGDGISKSFVPAKKVQTMGNTTVVSDDRSAQQKLTGIVGAGIGEGTKNSADRIAKYLIERAEQYQPVVLLQSGTEVEIVFLKGIDLNKI